MKKLVAVLLAAVACLVPVESASAHPANRPIRVEFELTGAYVPICSEALCGRLDVTIACPRNSRMLSSGFDTYTRGDRITFGILASHRYGNEKVVTFGGGESTGWEQEARLTATCLTWKAHL